MKTLSPPAVRLSTLWREGCGGASPFLPRKTPRIGLPPGFELLAALEADVPEALSGALPGARAHIDAALAGLPVDALPDPSGLDAPALDRLLTCASHLGHAYRWDRIPSPSQEFHVDHLGLPPALEAVWRRAARARGGPMVGTLWALHLCNWRLDGVPGDAPYAVADLHADRLSLLANFLPGRRGVELERFVGAFIRSEAVGADLLELLVPLLAAAERGDELAAAPLLEALPGQVKRLVTVFLEQIDPRHIDPDAWLDHIQRPYVWGVVDAESGERLEGASGMQLGVMSVLNSVLDVQSGSALAQSIRSSWALLLPHQRRFLEACEACRPVLRAFVSHVGRRALRAPFNAALDQLSAWRRCHQSRGARYFQGSGEGPSMEASTGLVVDGGSNLLTHFLKAMEERMVETHRSRLLRDEWTLTEGERALVGLIKASLDEDNVLSPQEARAIDSAREAHGVSPERLEQLLADRRLRSSFPRRDEAWLRAVHASVQSAPLRPIDWKALHAEGRAQGIKPARLRLLTVLACEALDRPMPRFDALGLES